MNSPPLLKYEQIFFGLISLSRPFYHGSKVSRAVVMQPPIIIVSLKLNRQEQAYMTWSETVKDQVDKIFRPQGGHRSVSCWSLLKGQFSFKISMSQFRSLCVVINLHLVSLIGVEKCCINMQLYPLIL